MSVEQLEALESALGARYFIRRELGRSRGAIVYLADDLKHQRPVAIKVLRQELAAAVDAQRFLREIATAAQLRHPHILPLLDSGEVDGVPYYVMPYLEGGSLRDLLLRDGALRMERVLNITREVADALDHAHAHGVVHRDIKPENILFDDGHAVVADFGIARGVTRDGESAGSGDGHLTETGIALGTPAYMSPEQAGGERLVDGRTDIYALGCVAYEMLAGEPPFSGASPQVVIARHMQERVPSLRVVRPTTAPATQRVLETALAKVPADRFATAGELAQALAASVTARTTTLRRTIMIGAVAIAVLALAVAARRAMLSDGDAATRGGASAVDRRRIAILYFEDLSPERTLGHVATGLTEDLIDRLSQVRSLSVVSPNGVRPYQGKTPPVDSLARVLHVGTIVGGSVTRAGTALRVNVRLIDGRSGQQMESWIVDQSWEDQLTLQERLVARIAVFLREHIDREIAASQQRAETKSVIAWETLRQAEDLLRRGTAAIRTQRGQLANDLLQGADSLDARAMRLDRTWVTPIVHRGRVALARSYLPTASAPTDTTSEGWVQRAVRLADEALRLEPRSAEALALRGEARWKLAAKAGDAEAATLLPLAESDLEAALEIRPDFARAWQALSELHWWQARFAEAASASRRALDADAFLPSVASVLSMLFSASLESGRFDEAAAWCRRGLQEYPADQQLVDCELALLGYTGRGADQVVSAWRQLARTEAADSLRVMEITWGYRRALVAAVLARTGMADSARAVLRRTKAQAARHPRSVDVPLIEAYVYVLLGDRDEALRALSRGVQSDRERTYVARSLWFRPLQDDPRFRALVRQSAG